MVFLHSSFHPDFCVMNFLKPFIRYFYWGVLLSCLYGTLTLAKNIKIFINLS